MHPTTVVVCVAVRDRHMCRGDVTRSLVCVAPRKPRGTVIDRGKPRGVAVGS